ncbi:hsp70 nucleotide exchange factor fes1, partial [Massospora cicadina]
LEPLKLWGPLIKLLTDEEVAIRKYAAWFLDHKGLEALLEAFRVERVAETSKKLVYSLSCSIRHHPRALAHLKELGGLQLISDKLWMPEYELSLKTRLLFTLGSLINDDSTIVTYLADVKIFQGLIELICNQSNLSDADFVEKVDF